MQRKETELPVTHISILRRLSNRQSETALTWADLHGCRSCKNMMEQGLCYPCRGCVSCRKRVQHRKSFKKDFRRKPMRKCGERLSLSKDVFVCLSIAHHYTHMHACTYAHTHTQIVPCSSSELTSCLWRSKTMWKFLSIGVWQGMVWCRTRKKGTWAWR